MKKFFLYGAAIILVAIVVIGFVAPKGATVQRSIVVNQPVENVYEYLLFLKNMEEYSPWQAKDPNVKQEYRGVDGTVGAVHRWTSEKKDVGVGEQEIKSIKVNEEIISELRFEKPFESTSEGFFKLKSVANGTEVIWGYHGTFGFMESIIMMFMDMDKVLGADFEEGLSKIKSNLEQ